MDHKGVDAKILCERMSKILDKVNMLVTYQDDDQIVGPLTPDDIRVIKKTFPNKNDSLQIRFIQSMYNSPMQKEELLLSAQDATILSELHEKNNWKGVCDFYKKRKSYHSKAYRFLLLILPKILG